MWGSNYQDGVSHGFTKNNTKLRRVLYSFPAHITNVTSSFLFIPGSDSIFVNPFDCDLWVKVPIQQKIEAIDWLHAQHYLLLPRCFFSGRTRTGNSDIFNGNGHNSTPKSHNLVSVAGVGSAVFFRHINPFSYSDWKSIKRYSSHSILILYIYIFE